MKVAQLLDEEGMVKVCRRIHKNAFGDIRMMLAIFKDIIDRKLQSVRRGLEKRIDKDPELAIAECKISLMEAMAVVDQKYGDVQRSIVTTLSLPLQTCLLALYFSMGEKSQAVPFFNLSS